MCIYCEYLNILSSTLPDNNENVSYHSYSKIGKKWVVLEKLAHIERQSVF